MRLYPWLLAGLVAGCGSSAPVENVTVNESDPVSAPPPVVETGPSNGAIPAAFHGVYDRDRASCARRSVYRLVVSADELRFHESVGKVRNVALEGADTINIAADYQGEGDSWRATQKLRLTDDNARLTVTGRGQETIRVRCGESEDAATEPSWDIASSGEGDGLYIQSRDGQRQLLLFCPARSNVLIVNVPSFRPIASEERMSLGSGGTVVALVADPRGDSDRGGVSGRGPIPAELEAILKGNAGVSVNYGAQNHGPHPAPPADMAANFLVGCRD